MRTKTTIFIAAVLAATRLSALSLLSDRFSMFTPVVDVPESVDEEHTFGSDLWWETLRLFSPWELSADSKVEAMGEYCWNGNYPSWNGSEWGGDVAPAGHDYGGMKSFISGEFRPDTDPDATSLTFDGTVTLVLVPSGEPIGSDWFMLNFNRDSWSTNFMPVTRFDDKAVSALYHVLDAAIERRFFAGEFTNQTWSTATYGPRNRYQAWLHIPDDPDDPEGEDPKRECYYSPQPGVELTDTTNRTVITRRFVEYGNIVSNFDALVRLSADFDAGGNRVHYPTVGVMPEDGDLVWSSSYLWNLWDDAKEPGEISTWFTWTGIPSTAAFGPHSFPQYSGLLRESPFYGVGNNGYLIRKIFPETHCFGNDDVSAARRSKLKITENPTGELRFDQNYPEYAPVSTGTLLVSNYVFAATNELVDAYGNPCYTRRLNPGFLAGWSQFLGLMNKTQLCYQNGMDTSLNIYKVYDHTMWAECELSVDYLDEIFSVDGGDTFSLWRTFDISEYQSADWEIVQTTNTVVSSAATNSAPPQCSAWIHVNRPDFSIPSERTTATELTYFTIDGYMLTTNFTWSQSVPEGTHRIFVGFTGYNRGLFGFEAYDPTIPMTSPTNFYGVADVRAPYGFTIPLRVEVSHYYEMEHSQHVQTPCQFQPGPETRLAAVASAALWGFHSFGYKPGTFGGFTTDNVFYQFCRAGYSDPAAIESDILTPWYNDILFKQCAIVTGTVDPWERVTMNDAALRGALAHAKLSADKRNGWIIDGEQAALDGVIKCENGQIEILGYYEGTNFVEAASKYMRLRMYSYNGIGFDAGTNRIDGLEAISAETKSTVTQIIDWNFNSLKPTEPGNEQ